MTTDRPAFVLRIRTLVLAAPLVLAAWGLILVGTTFAGSAGRPVAVFAPGGPDAALAAVVAAGGSILEIRANAVVAIAADAGFVGRLYAEGALLVVGAGGVGCGMSPGFVTASRTLA